MKVDGSSGTRGSGGAAVSPEKKKPRTPFSEVLKQPPDAGAAAPFAPPLPPVDPAPVTSGRSVAPGSDALVSSLVREITVHVPPAGAVSVDIQFDSRTLEGLHVRVQKSEQGVEVRLSTSSEAVSRLLTANAQSLTDALAQRGYAAPVVTVQRTQDSPAPSSADSGQPSRDPRDRGGDGRGGGQKRR
jgi:hypothetical protein